MGARTAADSRTMKSWGISNWMMLERIGSSTEFGGMERSGPEICRHAAQLVWSRMIFQPCGPLRHMSEKMPSSLVASPRVLRVRWKRPVTMA